jgi:hypothetical protein
VQGVAANVCVDCERLTDMYCLLFAAQRTSAAIDLHPSRSGQCYDVFHETYDDPAYARIVAATFEEFLAKLFERGKSYWFDEGFVSRYFDGGTQADD